VIAIDLRGLCVEAGGRRILEAVDLEVPEREHLLLVGPSGCGKTTLLRAIAGLAKPSAGRIELFGQLASEPGRLRLAPEKRGVGMLFQGGALWPHLSARRQLEFVLSCAGVAKPTWSSRVAELLEWVELPGYQERMPGTLSGGEAQRLALARAIAVSPRLLLLDEPLGPLDAELRGELLAKLNELQQRLGLTVVHVTHAPDEARGIATRTVRMRAGRIQTESAS
jgi:ABC-type Fe3+/spermidine/putrescine transport system ATPase subunit